MSNPILEMLNARAPMQMNSSLAQTISMIKNSRNPQQMLQSVAQNNPQVRQVINMIQNSNMSPKDLFYKMAKQKGVDPNQIVNMIK